MRVKSSSTFIFDLDGTLIDSFDQISECCLKIRRDLGMKLISRAEIGTLIGLPAEKLFSDNPPQVVEKAVSMFREDLSNEIENGNKVFKGVEEMLTLLKHRGFRIAVATSKPHNLAQAVVQNSSLRGLVDHVQGVDGFDPKPSPEVIKRCQIRLPAGRFAMIGDRPEDIQAGLNADCYCVGISQGTFGEKNLKEIGAHETFQSIEHLMMDIEGFLTRFENHE